MTGCGSETAIDGWSEGGFAKATIVLGERGRERHRLQEARKPREGSGGRERRRDRPQRTSSRINTLRSSDDAELILHEADIERAIS